MFLKTFCDYRSTSIDPDTDIYEFSHWSLSTLVARAQHAGFISLQNFIQNENVHGTQLQYTLTLSHIQHDDFENIKAKVWKIFINESII